MGGFGKFSKNFGRGSVGGGAVTCWVAEKYPDINTKGAKYF